MFCSLYGITCMYIDVLEKCATFWTTLYISPRFCTLSYGVVCMILSLAVLTQ